MNACLVQSINISDIITYIQSRINSQNDSETMKEFNKIKYLKKLPENKCQLKKQKSKSKIILQTNTTDKIKTIHDIV